MTFRFPERPHSRTSTSNPPTLELVYRAAGTTNNAFVESYARSATPAIQSTPYGTIYRQDLRVDPVGWSVWDVTVPYADRKNATGEWTWDFDTGGGTVHIRAGLETRGSFKAAGVAGDIPGQGNLIGVNGDEVAGTSIVVPLMRFGISYRHPFGVVTIPFAKKMHNLTGLVNNAPFLNFAPGEVLFLGARGSDGSATDATVNYQFAMSANASDLTIGGVASIVKLGWDVAWIKYQDDVAEGQPVKKAKYVFVERVYEEADLAAELGFG